MKSPASVHLAAVLLASVAAVASAAEYVSYELAFSTYFGGNRDAVVVVLSADFSRLLYSTLMGGPAYDHGRSAYFGQDGSLYLTGAADGPGWPVKNAYQPAFRGGPGGWGSDDNLLTEFRRLEN